MHIWGSLICLFNLIGKIEGLIISMLVMMTIMMMKVMMISKGAIKTFKGADH